jgi:hypothetical protein
MAACAQAVQQPDGRLVLELMPAATDLSTCQYVVQSGAELANSLFSLTAADGAKLSSAIVSLWIIAYVFRSNISLIKGSTNE